MVNQSVETKARHPLHKRPATQLVQQVVHDFHAGLKKIKIKIKGAERIIHEYIHPLHVVETHLTIYYLIPPPKSLLPPLTTNAFRASSPTQILRTIVSEFGL